MDELLINRRYWYYRVRCPAQPAATAARRHFLRHKSLLPATPLDIQLRPELHTGGIVMELCIVEDFWEGRRGGGGGIQFVPQISLYISTGGWKRFLSSVHVADTNKKSNSKASVIHVFESGVCSPGFGRLVVCNTFIFLSVSFSFFRSPSPNPSPSSLALATKPLCSPSLCGYPGAPAASLLQDSLVRLHHLLSFLSHPSLFDHCLLLFTSFP